MRREAKRERERQTDRATERVKDFRIRFQSSLVAYQSRESRCYLLDLDKDVKRQVTNTWTVTRLHTPHGFMACLDNETNFVFRSDKTLQSK